MADTLGCGTYEVYFNTRGGGTHIFRARNLIQVTWNRTLNEVSEAQISFALNGQDEACCNGVGTINPWQHEISIYRSGVEVWCGPVINATIDLEKMTATYQAKDLSAWFDHRWVELQGSDQEWEEADVTEVYAWLVNHAYGKDPWNMEWYLSPMGIPMDRTYIGSSSGERWAGSFPSVGDELRDLSQYGLDFTTVRRTMIGGNLEDANEQPTARLIDKAWSTLPQIQITGGGMSTEIAVAGGNAGYTGWYDDQIWIERMSDPTYGLLQTFYPAPELDDEDTTKLPNAITQKAYNLHALKAHPYVYVKGGSLSQEAPVTFDQLIPGRVFRVELLQTCRTIEADYRLYGVSVEFNGQETITPQLTPLGAEAIADGS
jgi:hypothetical protein